MPRPRHTTLDEAELARLDRLRTDAEAAALKLAGDDAPLGRVAQAAGLAAAAERLLVETVTGARDERYPWRDIAQSLDEGDDDAAVQRARKGYDRRVDD